MAPTTAIAHLAAMAAPKLGSNFTRPSPLEVECAEKLLEVVPGAEMAKFTKDGSTATTAAVRLARASLHGRRCGSVLHAGVRQSPQRQEDRRQAQGLTAGSIDDYRRASAGRHGVDHDKSDRRSRRASLAPHCAAAALHNNRFGAVPDSSHKLTMGMGDRRIRPTVVARGVAAGDRTELGFGPGEDRYRFGQFAAPVDPIISEEVWRKAGRTPCDLKVPRLITLRWWRCGEVLHERGRVIDQCRRATDGSVFRRPSRSRQRSIFARILVSRSSADAVGAPARCSIWLSRSWARSCRRTREISMRTQSSFEVSQVEQVQISSGATNQRTRRGTNCM
jgi:hypothetical protein